MKKHVSIISILFCMSIVSWSAQASLIFKFDNASVPEVNFVGVEASDFYIGFGADDFDIGDAFDLMVGALPGQNDIAEQLNIFANFDDIGGFGFGDVLNLVPATEQFFVTIVPISGSFDVSQISIFFRNVDNAANFSGIPQRAPAVAVSEPSSLLLLASTIGFLWLFRLRKFLIIPLKRKI